MLKIHVFFPIHSQCIYCVLVIAILILKKQMNPYVQFGLRLRLMMKHTARVHERCVVDIGQATNASAKWFERARKNTGWGFITVRGKDWDEGSQMQTRACFLIFPPAPKEGEPRLSINLSRCGAEGTARGET